MTGKPNHHSSSKAQPTHDVKLKRQIGEKVSYERIGAAWERDDGSLYVKLIGTQVVSEGFNIYPIEAADER